MESHEHSSLPPDVSPGHLEKPHYFYKIDLTTSKVLTYEKSLG